MDVLKLLILVTAKTIEKAWCDIEKRHFSK
jgi:hypothetical protein